MRPRSGASGHIQPRLSTQFVCILTSDQTRKMVFFKIIRVLAYTRKTGGESGLRRESTELTGDRQSKCNPLKGKQENGTVKYL